MEEFKEYQDNGDNYTPPERQEVTEVLDIRLYCNHEGCKKYIIGKEGYNGAFTAETGQQADLRNQMWICSEHEPEVEMTKIRAIAILKLDIGKKVQKKPSIRKGKSYVGKPFKSGQRINTVKDVINHPILNIPAYTFEEDDSYVECRRCEIVNNI